MINYILQVILFQVLFLAVYDFFLSKETFFTKNRWYLLSTPVLSFVLPLIKIPTFQKAVPQEFVIQLPEIVLNPDKIIKESITTSSFTNSINSINILFWIGVALFSVLFLIKLVKIISFIKYNESIKKSDFILILIPNQTKAFSFFNYIFLGKEVPKHQQEKVIQHELVHSQQKHSLDLLLFEFLKIVMWFNPMIYFYQKRITLVHEYISDSVVAKSETKESYINNLLSSFFQVENIEFVNQFCKKSFVKQRILMITKKQSKTVNQLKYLVLVPVLVSMLLYSSCLENSTFSNNDSSKQLITLYRDIDGELTAFKGNEFSYLDNFVGGKPLEGMKEVSFNDLSKNEQKQYHLDLEHFKKAYHKSDDYKDDNARFFKMPNGRIAVAMILDGFMTFSKQNNEIDEISFLKMEKTPTFPGCEEKDEDCFFKELEQHFYANFNKDVINTIFISTGKKKVLVDFSIDVKGKVVDVAVKSPHIVISEEAKRVMDALPKMTSGTKYGKPVKTKYRLPFIILIE